MKLPNTPKNQAIAEVAATLAIENMYPDEACIKEIIAKEKHQLDIMLKRFRVDEELKHHNKTAWKKRYDRTREYVRKNLREELER